VADLARRRWAVWVPTLVALGTALGGLLHLPGVLS
jgi:hypothetical protein